jgi:hypothetical protein
MAVAFHGNPCPHFGENDILAENYLWQGEAGDDEDAKIASWVKMWKEKSWTSMHADSGAPWTPTFSDGLPAFSDGLPWSPRVYSTIHVSGAGKIGSFDHDATEAVLWMLLLLSMCPP